MDHDQFLHTSLDVGEEDVLYRVSRSHASSLTSDESDRKVRKGIQLVETVQQPVALFTVSLAGYCLPVGLGLLLGRFIVLSPWTMQGEIHYYYRQATRRCPDTMPSWIAKRHPKGGSCRLEIHHFRGIPK